MARFTLVIGNKAYSSWSLRAWLGTRLAGADVEEVVVPLDRPETRAAIAAHSPSGKVPVLKGDGVTVWESLAILDHLARLFPDAGLWPNHTAARAHALAVSAEMHAGFAALRRHMPMDLKQDHPGAGRTDAVAADIARIVQIWQDCRARFGKDGPFLFGRPGIADAMYAPVVMRFRGYAVALDPVCQGYADAILALPAIQAWIAEAKTEPWVIDAP